MARKVANKAGNETGASSLEWLQHAVAQSRIALYEWDLKSGEVTWSDNSADIFHLNGQVLSTYSDYEQLIPESRRPVIHRRRSEPAKINGGSFNLEYCLELPDGQNLLIQETGRHIRDKNGKPKTIVGSIFPKRLSESDVTNTALIQSSLQEAYHYPNDFIEALNHALKEHQHTNSAHGALMVFAVDNMSMIIGGYGHDKAESIMDAIEQEMESLLNDDMALFRIQRDQFAVIAPKQRDSEMPDVMQAISGKIREYGMKSAIQPLHIVASAGSVSFDACYQEQPDNILLYVIDKAYVALKANGMVMSAFPNDTIESQSDSINQMEMANYLHKAMHKNKLQLAYQPIVKSTDGSISHYECLLRLKTEDGQINSAGALIPVAERMGFIDMIDQLVLEMVIEDLLRDPDVVLAFNISNLTTNDRNWLDTFTKMMEATPEVAPRLIVEVTETAAQRDIKDTAYFVAALQAMGCRVALDDFGSGYTSFRQLRALSCDMLKIDGSFILDVEHNKDNQYFVKTLLDFTKGFGLETVAECIENGEAAKVMMDLGVDLMQGYYFGRPENERNWDKSEQEKKAKPKKKKQA